MTFSERFRVTSAECSEDGYRVTAVPDAPDRTGAYLFDATLILNLRPEGQSREIEPGMICYLSGSFFHEHELGGVRDATANAAAEAAAALNSP